MLLCLCPGVLTCFLISYAYACVLVKTSLKGGMDSWRFFFFFFLSGIHLAFQISRAPPFWINEDDQK